MAEAGTMIKQLITSLALCLTVAAANITFTWDVYPHTNYTGYVIDHSKVPVAGAYRFDFTNWTASYSVAGRLTTTMTVFIPGTNLPGTNWFYLTATGPQAGTNVVYPSPLSLPVTLFSATNRPANFLMGSVEIQSTTNLANIHWETEEILPVALAQDAESQKYWRAFVNIKQGDAPLIPWLPAPPPPSP